MRNFADSSTSLKLVSITVGMVAGGQLLVATSAASEARAMAVRSLN